MRSAFGDELLEVRLRAVLEERAEEVASRARTAQQVAAELAPRLRAADRASIRRQQVLRLGWLAAILVLLLALVAAIGAGRPRSPLALKLAVDMPLGGEQGTETIVDAVRLAIRDARGGAGGFTLQLSEDGVFDDTVAGMPDGARGAENMRRIAADAGFVAVIGPYNSPVAEAEIPVTNGAGILQCGPSNTAPGLTTGERATSLRPRPDRPNYVRVAVTDDALARGAARFLLDSLGGRSVYVVYAGHPFPGDPGLAFVADFEARGGAVVGNTVLSDGPDSIALLASRIAVAGADAVFYDGPSGEGARVVTSLSAARHVPVVGLDPLLDGPRTAPGSFLNVAGDSAANVYGLFPAGRDAALGSRFEAEYRAAFGVAPARYAASGYACAQVVLTALEGLDLLPSAGPEAWRDALRARVTEPGLRYPTVLGSIGFDGNGDIEPAVVSVFGYDGSSDDWTFAEALEVGSTP
jgi:ABC-type branched-subunit amino acid transport system substrate-binding protein